MIRYTLEKTQCMISLVIKIYATWSQLIKLYIKNQQSFKGVVAKVILFFYLVPAL